MAKQFFKNLPDTSTPITADRLNDLLDGEEALGNLVVDSIRSKNVANDTTLKKGLWASGNNIGSNATGWYVVVSIEGGKTYTISRKYIGSLYATTTTTFPASGVAQVDSWRGNEGIKQLTITTSNSAKYLFLGLLGGTSPTDTQKSQAIEELMVEEGDTATTYSPYQQLDIPTSENFISRVNFVSGEESASGLFRKIGNQVIIMYQGQNKVHNGETLLFTLPEGYRPPTLIVVPFTKWSQAYGQIILYDNGQCKIGNISSTSATGRIAFNMTYTID